MKFGQPLDTPWAKSSPFNAPRDYSNVGGKANDKHEGVDVVPTVGSIAHVLAVADGVVTKAGASKGYGNYCVVASRHNDRVYFTWRAHMDFVSVSVGQQVKRGDVLGICGSSGNSTGRHDHLTMISPGPGALSGYILPDVIDPTPFYPEPAAGIDMLPYLKGDGRMYQMKVLWQGQEHSQQMQTQVSGTRFYQVKNSEWEELWASGAYLYRGIDTSPGNGEYYVQRTDTATFGAKWMPRTWYVGGLYERNPLVSFHRKSDGVLTAPPGYRKTYLRFAAHHKTWNGGGITLADVVELHWLLTPGSQNAERYFYARGYGLVGWSSWSGDRSYITQAFQPGERQPAVRESVASPKY